MDQHAVEHDRALRVGIFVAEDDVHAADAVDAHLSGDGTFSQLQVDLTSAALTMKIIWETMELASQPKNVPGAVPRDE